MRRRSSSTAALAVVALVALGSGCGGGSGDNSAAQQTVLTFRFTDGGGASTVTLTCPGKDTGTKSACAQLAKVAPDVFSPVPKAKVCTQIFGGPEKLAVSGHYDNTIVSAGLSRENGCEIDRWDMIAPVLKALALVGP
ncbi:hypothetical protein [Aeromicrobium sp.]|uniref:hypothetical protein n=1 Tax=Aeromicrobium sp. TaxID=1871063 RepID=UPI0019B15064|nr:hypothetical protein [Aeromicrobium sp.]MBC7630007.1 hypothetical protein [Aeromicrobium sp.]